MSTKTAKVEISLTENNFDSWLDKPYIDNELKSQLAAANFLIVPQEPSNSVKRPFFYEGTLDTYNFLVASSPEEVNVDLAVKDDDYVELALHFDYVLLGTFVVQNIIAPIAATLIVEAIKDRLGPKTANKTVKFKLIIAPHELTGRENKPSVQLEYEGSPDDLEEVLLQSYKAAAELESSGEASRKCLEFPSRW